MKRVLGLPETFTQNKIGKSWTKKKRQRTYLLKKKLAKNWNYVPEKTSEKAEFQRNNTKKVLGETNQPQDDPKHENEVLQIEIFIKEMIIAILKSSCFKQFGIDGLHVTMLKKSDDAALILLLNLLNVYWQ